MNPPSPDSSVVVSPFVTRQTPQSKFSHFDGTWDQIVALVKRNIGASKPGYMPGVWRVPVPPDGFFSSVCKLSKGSPVRSYMAARREGEEEFLQSVVTEG